MDMLKDIYIYVILYLVLHLEYAMLLFRIFLSHLIIFQLFSPFSPLISQFLLSTLSLFCMLTQIIK